MAKSKVMASLIISLTLGLCFTVSSYSLAAPSYQRGKILFQEDFSKDLSQWTLNSDVWGIANGRLEMKPDASVSQESDAMIILNQGVGWKNYSFEFDGWFTTDEAYVIAPLFRAADIDNLYMYQIAGPAVSTPNAIRKHVRSEANWAVDPVDAGIEFISDQKYHFAFDLYGNTISTYIDGKLIDQTTDDTFAAGTIGFRGWGIEEAQAIDNIVVTELVAK